MYDAITKVYEDAGKTGNANMEVTLARGLYGSLAEHINSLREDTTTKPIDVSEMNTATKLLFTGGSVPVVGINAVGTENYKDKSLTAQKTSFLELNTSVNMFNGIYSSIYIGGASGLLSIVADTSRKGKTAIIPVAPSTSYSIALSKDIPTFLKVTSSSKLWSSGSPFDGAINMSYGETTKVAVVKTGPNDKYLYVNTTLDNTVDTPLLRVIKSTEFIDILEGDPYPIEPKNVSIYSKREVDEKLKEPLSAEQLGFLDYTNNNLFDGNYLVGEYLGGSSPLTLQRSNDHRMAAVKVKPNTKYTILKKPVPIQDGYFYFKVATSAKSIDELMSRSASVVMDGPIYLTETSKDTERYSITTGDDDITLLVNTGKYHEPYLEIVEGEWYDFQYDDYGQGKYKFNIDVEMKDNVDIDVESPKSLEIKRIDDQNVLVLIESSTGNYVGYTYGIDVKPLINLNVWRLKDIALYDQGKHKRFSVTSGDNEGVLRLKGEADYIGGIHGDEVTTDFHMFIDGIKTEVSELLEPMKCESVEFIVGSDLFNADLPTKIMTKVKTVFIDKTGVRIRNVWNPLNDVELVHARATLLSIHKIEGGLNLITHYRDTLINPLPTPVPPNGTTTSMPSHKDLNEIIFYGGELSARIWSIERGGDSNYGSITDFGTRLKAYIDSYKDAIIPAGQLLVDEHKFQITTK